MPSPTLSTAAPLLLAVPWCVTPLFLRLRLGTTPSLDDVEVTPALLGSTPRVSVIIPMRNEAAHADACLRAVRASTWPDLEIIVVDDHSTDDTLAIVRRAAEDDARVTVVSAPPLADGWFGKQWACHAGAARARGSLLLFTDADTRHAPELISRMVVTRAHRGAELLSVAGHQEMRTVWERAVQPLMFMLILARYGGAATLERARRASDVVANGQCFLLSRSAYDAIGGHEAVRDFVAEDVMIAQAVWMHGYRVSLALGQSQLSTHMYDGLAPLVRGWSKNVYAGGRHAVRWGRLGQLLYPAGLLAFPLLMLLPMLALIALCVAQLSRAAVAPVWWWSAALASAGVLLTGALLNRFNGDPMRRAVLVPLGAGVLFGIFALAVVRGSNVRWKDRGYQAR